MSLELTEIGRKMHKEWGRGYISKEILLSDRWKKNKNFAANRKIEAIARPMEKMGVESGQLGQVNNSGIKKKDGSSNIGEDFKLMERDYKFELALSVSKLNSEKELSLESIMGDKVGKGKSQREKTASSYLIVTNSTSPRMDPKKSEKEIDV